ncbi:hypothetical protein GGI43DRAFT_313030 [Trichoderma evansii]
MKEPQGCVVSGLAMAATLACLYFSLCLERSGKHSFPFVSGEKQLTRYHIYKLRAKILPGNWPETYLLVAFIAQLEQDLLISGLSCEI